MRRILVFALWLPCAFGQSGSVSNVAPVSQWTSSMFNGTTGLPSNGSQVTPGSLAVISYYGPPPGGMPAKVSLRPAGSSGALAAQVVSADAQTITFRVPADAPPGPAQVVYQAAGAPAQWTTVTVVATNFALSGRSLQGPVFAQVAGAKGLRQLGLATPMANGDAVVLFGSGLGATAASDISVSVGGTPETVVYAGSSPGLPGADQINFRVSDGTPNGCYLPLVVKYGAQSVTTWVSKSADGSACAHPLGLSLAQLQTLDRGDSISLPQVTISSRLEVASAEHASREEGAWAVTTSYDSGSMAALFAPVVSGCSAGASLVYIYSASIYDPEDTSSAGTLTNGSSAVAVSNGVSLRASADAPLPAVSAPVLTVGAWTLHLNSGLTATLPLAAPIQMKAGAPVVLRRDADQTITWSGGDSPGAVALISIARDGVNAANPLVSCVIPAASGSVTIPNSLVSGLNAGAVTVAVRSISPPPPGGAVVIRALSMDSRAGDLQ